MCRGIENDECGIVGVGEKRVSREVMKTSNFGPRTRVPRMRSGREAQPRYPLEVTAIAREKSCLMLQHDTGDETIALPIAVPLRSKSSQMRAVWSAAD